MPSFFSDFFRNADWLCLTMEYFGSSVMDEGYFFFFLISRIISLA